MTRSIFPILFLLVTFSSSADSYNKESYPLCNNFLDVTWVDKDSYFGIFKIDQELEKGRHTAIWNFFAISKNGFIMYKFDDMISKYGEEKLLDILQSADYKVDPGYRFLTLKSGDISEEIWSTNTINFRKNKSTNLCVFLPSKKKVWIFKPAMIKDSYSKDKIKHYLDQIVGAGIKPYRLWSIENSTYFDLNSDGKLDFLHASSPKQIVYSYKESYRETDRGVCEIPGFEPRYILYDGKYIYISTFKVDCNINNLIKESGYKK